MRRRQHIGPEIATADQARGRGRQIADEIDLTRAHIDHSWSRALVLHDRDRHAGPARQIELLRVQGKCEVGIGRVDVQAIGKVLALQAARLLEMDLEARAVLRLVVGGVLQRHYEVEHVLAAVGAALPAFLVGMVHDQDSPA